MLWKLTPVCVAYTFGIVSVSTQSACSSAACTQQHTCKGGSYKGLAATLCCCEAVENFYNSQLSLEVLLLSTSYMPKKGYTISPVQYYHTQDKNKTKPERGKNKCNLNAPKQRLAFFFPFLHAQCTQQPKCLLMQCIVFMLSQIW